MSMRPPSEAQSVDPGLELAAATLIRMILLRRVSSLLGQEFHDVAFAAYIAAFVLVEDEEPQQTPTPEERRRRLQELLEAAPADVREFIEQHAKELLQSVEDEAA